ncbi:hypothetical protein GH741_03795 [Aquibacillus halophilus]|uniref:Uncharacterized protein n=1 Tax=Aquibacillus halophilus TaxID=930132 RepID=A0A6A8D7R3_9BACI|nr:hypothetical protein [Aquibacillus halophilus]MRH41793.1 hypothetical protein [Aquibacillus halophilus]
MDQQQPDYDLVYKQDQYRIFQKASFWYWGLLLFLSGLAFFYLNILPAIVLAFLLFTLSIPINLRRLMYFLVSIGITVLLMFITNITFAIIIGIIATVICVVNNKYVNLKQKTNKYYSNAS